MGYRHTLGSLFSKFFQKKFFSEIFSWVSVGIEVVVLLFWCHCWLLRVVVECILF